MQRRSFFAVVCGAVTSLFFPQKKAEARADSLSMSNLSVSSKASMLGLSGSKAGVCFLDKSPYKPCDFCGGEATIMRVKSKLTGHVERQGSRWATWEPTKARFFCERHDPVHAGIM